MFCRNIKYFKITDKQTTTELDIYITGILMKKREKRKQKKDEQLFAKITEVKYAT